MTFSQSSLEINSLVLFGVILLLGLLGGEITKLSRFLPRITGYIMIGFLVGPGGFNIINQAILEHTRLFIDISLSLILFELGRHLNFVWLKHDRGLLPMAMAESGFTFSLVFILLYYFVKLTLLSALLGAAIAIATSPAVTMMVAHDLYSEGPVTRRTLILTSLNNFFSITLFTVLVPLTQFPLPQFTPKIILMNSSYRLFGSVLLGLASFKLASYLAKIIGKQENNQFILFVGIVILTLGLTHMLNLSTMLTLFVLGVAARNLDQKHVFMEIDFKRFARLFFILLFVITGAYLQPWGIYHALWATLIFLTLRIVGKTIGVWLFANSSRLTTPQTKALTLTLLPMGGVSVGMSNRLMDYNPDSAADLLPIIALSIAILNVVGPIITQYAFIKVGEADPVIPKYQGERT
ncbi:MAG: cation:proton antiporter [Candidatus Saccharimonadaceae bacterium]